MLFTGTVPHYGDISILLLFKQIKESAVVVKMKKLKNLMDSKVSSMHFAATGLMHDSCFFAIFRNIFALFHPNNMMHH